MSVCVQALPSVQSVPLGAGTSTGQPLWSHVLPFVLLTLLFLALPSLAVVALGERGQKLLPKVRDWMNDNSWVVSEIVIALFVVITLSGMSG